MESLNEELLVATSLGPQHPVLLSLEANLLERGVSFRTWELPSEGASGDFLPAGLKALLIDAESLKLLFAREGNRKDLDEFSKTGGYLALFRTGEAPDRVGDGFLNSVFADSLHAPLVEELIAYAGLTRNHPGARALRLDREVRALVHDERERVQRWVRSEPLASEFFLHYGRSIGALMDAGDDELGALFEKAAEGALRSLAAEPLNHDTLTVLYAAAVLARRGRKGSLLQDSRAMLGRTLDRRPGFQGMPSGSGFADAPLGAFGSGGTGEGTGIAGPINGFGAHNVVSNEMLHFHAPVFAALGREFSDAGLKAMAVAICDHVYTVHAMPSGLLHHISREGCPAGWAWGRGQTHALYGLAYTLEELDPGTSDHARLTGYLRCHVKALIPFQDEKTGLWRNLVDCPDARVESSCTVGIAFALARALREGWIDARSADVALDRAWAGIRLMMHRSGLAAMCRGTLAGDSRSHYLSRPQGWGRVPQILMLALELVRLGKIPATDLTNPTASSTI